nr:hypothetical protein [Candidatus Woesearchaeota archaeon]
MDKKAKDLKKGDKITLDNEKFIVEKVEVSKLGKHGKSKCRLELKDKKGSIKIAITLADDVFKLE